nr:hypothetical protein CFP56_63405 [Quercus suber]POE94751.1 hypothetical protein CFP56_16988 [Quercus suber]
MFYSPSESFTYDCPSLLNQDTYWDHHISGSPSRRQSMATAAGLQMAAKADMGIWRTRFEKSDILALCEFQTASSWNEGDLRSGTCSMTLLQQYLRILACQSCDAAHGPRTARGASASEMFTLCTPAVLVRFPSDPRVRFVEVSPNWAFVVPSHGRGQSLYPTCIHKVRQNLSVENLSVTRGRFWFTDGQESFLFVLVCLIAKGQISKLAGLKAADDVACAGAIVLHGSEPKDTASRRNSPKMVIVVGSPPKAHMLVLAHYKARRASNKAEFCSPKGISREVGFDEAGESRLVENLQVVLSRSPVAKGAVGLETLCDDATTDLQMGSRNSTTNEKAAKEGMSWCLLVLHPGSIIRSDRNASFASSKLENLERVQSRRHDKHRQDCHGDAILECEFHSRRCGNQISRSELRSASNSDCHTPMNVRPAASLDLQDCEQ